MEECGAAEDELVLAMHFPSMLVLCLHLAIRAFDSSCSRVLHPHSESPYPSAQASLPEICTGRCSVSTQSSLLPLSCLPGLQSPCSIVPQPMCEPVRSQFRTRQPSMSRLQTFVPSSFSFADYSLHRTSCLRCEGCYSAHGGS